MVLLILHHIYPSLYLSFPPAQSSVLRSAMNATILKQPMWKVGGQKEEPQECRYLELLFLFILRSEEMCVWWGTGLVGS